MQRKGTNINLQDWFFKEFLFQKTYTCHHDPEDLFKVSTSVFLHNKDFSSLSRTAVNFGNSFSGSSDDCRGQNLACTLDAPVGSSKTLFPHTEIPLDRGVHVVLFFSNPHLVKRKRQEHQVFVFFLVHCLFCFSTCFFWFSSVSPLTSRSTLEHPPPWGFLRWLRILGVFF